MPNPGSLPHLPEHLERELLRFDASWDKPGVDLLRLAYPAEAGAEYLMELIHIDALKRIAADMTVDEALYLEAFPVLREDAALLQKVRAITFTPLQTGRSVLRALAATTPILHQVNLPAADPAATIDEPSSPSKLPEHRYTLEGEIARGGMGAVLRGRDEDLGREIAVKVMLQNHAGKTELLQRFVEEAQIAGQLQHPGITPVYELGRFPDQRPYFTMKLVRGQTLATLLKDRSDPSSERPRFLKVFEQICQTLAYAHTRKVIHRDLKPNNIMVGSFGEVQVMDWGLAKVLAVPAEGAKASARPLEPLTGTESSVQTKRSSGHSTDIPNTQAGSVLGTPAYMAPEQARGDIDQLDERADIFGLGAILCEILTGKPPYVGADGMEIYRKAVDAELADAHARLQSCGADPELISLAQSCLAAQREDRPRDASVLTKELTSYLHSVEERLKQAELTAVQATTKAVEESKRRQVTFRLAAVILVTLLAGLAGSLWQMQRALTAEQSAKDERDAKEIQRQRAETNEKTAMLRLAQIEKGVDLLAGVLQGIDPKNEDASKPPLYVQLAERAGKAADQLEAQSVGDALAVARLQTILGTTLRELGDYPKSIAVLEKARDVRIKELGPEHVETLDTLNSLGNGYLLAGRHDDAIALFLKLRDAGNKTLGPEHKNTLMTLQNLAVAYRQSSRLPESIAILKQVGSVQERTLGKDHPDTLLSKNNLGTAFIATGQYAEAISLLKQVYDVESSVLGTTHASTMETINNLAMAMQKSGKEREAIAFYETIRPTLLGKLGADHPTTLTLLGNIAVAYDHVGQMSKALELYEQVYAGWLKKLGPTHPMTLLAHHNLGGYYSDIGKHTEAIKILKEVHEARVKVLGPDHLDTCKTMGSLARAYHTAHRNKEAIALFEKVRAHQVKQFGMKHADTLGTINNLAEALRDDDQLDKAITLYEQIRPLLLQVLGQEHPSTLTMLGNLASAYADTGKQTEAIKQFEELREIAVKKLGDRHPVTLATLNNLGAQYWKAKQLDKSIPVYEDLLKRVVVVLGRKHRNTVGTIANLGVNYKDAGRYKEAQPLLEEVYGELKNQPAMSWIIDPLLEVYEKTGQTAKTTELISKELAQARKALPKDSTKLGDVLAQFGMKLLQIKDFPGAEPLLRESLAIRQKAQPDVWTTFNTMSTLGGALLGQKKYADAEPLLVQGYEGLKARTKAIPPQGSTRLPDALNRLILLYTETNKPDEVQKWKKEQEKIPPAGAAPTGKKP